MNNTNSRSAVSVQIYPAYEDRCYGRLGKLNDYAHLSSVIAGHLGLEAKNIETVQCQTWNGNEKYLNICVSENIVTPSNFYSVVRDRSKVIVHRRNADEHADQGSQPEPVPAV